MGKRKNGEGSWGTKNIKGVRYKYYRDANGKYTYGKTEKEVKEKLAKKEKNNVNNSDTFGKYLLWYYQNIHKNSIDETTYNSYITQCNAIIDCKYYDLANIQMRNFSVDHNYIQEYINAITPHYALNTIKGYIGRIRTAIRYAERHNLIEAGLISYGAIKMPKESNVGHKAKEVPFLRKQTADQLYVEITRAIYPTTGNPRYSENGWAILLCIHTGLRVGELKALKWNDIDFENKKLYVDENMARVKNADGNGYKRILKNTKNKSSERIIPLNSIAIEMLKKFESINPNHKPDDLVCIYRRSRNTVLQMRLTAVTDAALKRIGSEVEHCSPHGLRHTFGSILYEQGVEWKEISKLLGHSSIKTTMDIYIGLVEEQLHDAVKKLEVNTSLKEE